MEAGWRATIHDLNGNAPSRHVLLKAGKRLFKRARKVKKSTRAMHRLRIAAKKLRYTMEVTGHHSDARLHQIKKLQKHLGAVNDYRAALSIVAEEGAAKNISLNLKGQQREEIQVFEQHWKRDFEGKEDEWMKSFAHASK